MAEFTNLIRARQFIVDAVKDAGGCDHDAGICMCQDLALVAAIDNQIMGDQVRSIIHTFTGGARNAKERYDFAIAGASAIAKMARDYAGDYQDLIDE